LQVKANQRIIRENGNAFQHRSRVGNFSDYVIAIGQRNGVRARVNGHQDRPELGLAGNREGIKRIAQGAEWIGDFTDLDNACMGGAAEANKHDHAPKYPRAHFYPPNAEKFEYTYQIDITMKSSSSHRTILVQRSEKY
jgi:hypothetical protein